MSNSKKIVSGIIVVFGLILMVIFTRGATEPASQPKLDENQTAGVKVLATTPAKLDGGIVSPTDTIEITFNKPMVRDDTRIVIEPAAEYKTDLSADHKTIKIIPNFKLGASYTLTIKSGYDTDTGEELGSDQTFHFETVSYDGV